MPSDLRSSISFFFYCIGICEINQSLQLAAHSCDPLLHISKHRESEQTSENGRKTLEVNQQRPTQPHLLIKGFVLVSIWMTNNENSFEFILF